MQKYFPRFTFKQHFKESIIGFTEAVSSIDNIENTGRFLYFVYRKDNKINLLGKIGIENMRLAFIIAEKFGMSLQMDEGLPVYENFSLRGMLESGDLTYLGERGFTIGSSSCGDIRDSMGV